MWLNLVRSWSGPPTFRVYGKTRGEKVWRVVEVHATARRDVGSPWPGWRGTCTCWSADWIAVGWDFAQRLLSDPQVWQVTQEMPVEVVGGRLGDPDRRQAAGGPPYPSDLEIMAHEIGHTGQALRYRWLYLPVVGAVTCFGEGPHWWHRFENEASAIGQFGGVVPGSVDPALRALLSERSP